MKMEFIGSASAGFFALAGSWLVAHGSSWPILIFAALGAILAVMELDELEWRRVVTLLLFNTLVGAFGSPIVLKVIAVEISTLPPGAQLLLPFVLGVVAHSVLMPARGVLRSAAERWLKGWASK